MFDSLRKIHSNLQIITVFCDDSFLVERNPGMNGKRLPDGDYQLYSK